MTYMFANVLTGITGQQILDKLNNDRPLTVCTIGCLNLQVRVLNDDDAVPEPDTDQYDWPHLWQAVGIECAVVLYGEVLARESIWGVWMFQGPREHAPDHYNFAETLKTEVCELTGAACDRLKVAIAQRLDRLQSAADLVACNGIRPGSHISVSV
jgi:hypothetical protein